jgi:hypothetical protein
MIRVHTRVKDSDVHPESREAIGVNQVGPDQRHSLREGGSKRAVEIDRFHTWVTLEDGDGLSIGPTREAADGLVTMRQAKARPLQLVQDPRLATPNHGSPWSTARQQIIPPQRDSHGEQIGRGLPQDLLEMRSQLTGPGFGDG